MHFERATLEIDGAVAVLTLNHPEVLNALSPPMIAGLIAALDEVEASDSAVRCLVMTGAGRAFCAGVNLREGGSISSPKLDAGAVLETMYHPLLRRLRDLRIPLVAAVNGACAGGGMGVALMADIILAARTAYFLQAFRGIGLVPDCGSTWLLPRLIGRARALELSMLGERLPAETAMHWGIVNRICDGDTLREETLKLARNLAAGPTVALGLIRRLYWESTGNSYEEQLDLECQFQRTAGRSADFREGVTAFLEKRPAKFQGK
jgi:2-(1,2-epoxy-1,2-dihydrophenyl)acetyl-CoA isomerase